MAVVCFYSSSIFFKIVALLTLSSTVRCCMDCYSSANYSRRPFYDLTVVNTSAIELQSVGDHAHRPAANVYNVSPALLWSRPPGSVPFRPRPRRSIVTSFIAFLLLTVETNPGPAGIRLGVFNARVANRKGAQLDDLIRDHELDVLALNETWIRDDAPAAVKHDIVPDNFRILHTHRDTIGRRRTKRGGGLALIYSHNLTARFHNCNIKPTSFELQVVELKIGRIPVLIANIYRPPSSSKSDFL